MCWWMWSELTAHDSARILYEEVSHGNIRIAEDCANFLFKSRSVAKYRRQGKTVSFPCFFTAMLILKIFFLKYLLQRYEMLELFVVCECGWLLWVCVRIDQGMQWFDAVKVVLQKSWKTYTLVHKSVWKRFIRNVFAETILK